MENILGVKEALSLSLFSLIEKAEFDSKEIPEIHCIE